MSLVNNHLPALIFLCGVLYEAACVGFVHFEERGNPLMTALFSMLAGLTQMTGVLESVHDWNHAPPFIFGYGVGAFLATWLKCKLKDK